MHGYPPARGTENAAFVQLTLGVIVAKIGEWPGRVALQIAARLRGQLKQNQRRNGADAKARRYAGQFVGVHFGDKPTASTAGSDFNQLGRDHLTGTTPRRPEIDQHGQRRPTDERVELRYARHLDWFCRRGNFRARPCR